MRDRVLIFWVPLLAFLSPFINIFQAISLPYPSVWTTAFLAILFLIAAVIGLVLAMLEKPERKQGIKLSLLRVLILGWVVIFALDISFNGHGQAMKLFTFVADLPKTDKIPVLIAIFMAFYLLLCGALWLVRERAAVILFTVFGSMALASVAEVAFGNEERDALAKEAELEVTAQVSSDENVTGGNVAPNNQASFIYIIVDEMIGAEGIDPTLPGGEDAYRIVRDFHNRFGFRLYGKTFSRHYKSAVSIPNTLNFDYLNVNDVQVNLLSDIKLFDKMKSRGYEPVVYQTVHINFCGAGQVSRCETFDSFNPQNEYIHKKYQSHNLWKLFSMVVKAMKGSYFKAAASRVLPRVANMVGVDASIVQASRYELHGFEAWFDKFKNDVASSNRGSFYFFHLMAPHSPHVLNSDCELQPRWPNPYYLLEEEKLTGADFDQARRGHYERYFEQVSCVYKKLDELMVAIDQSDDLRDATIVIHGDHGSRISSGQYLEFINKQDFVDNYSSHFAIRSPEIDGGYDLRLVSVQRLIAELFGEEGGDSVAAEPTVAVDSKEKKGPVTINMPNFSMGKVDMGRVVKGGGHE